MFQDTFFTAPKGAKPGTYPGADFLSNKDVGHHIPPNKAGWYHVEIDDKGNGRLYKDASGLKAYASQTSSLAEAGAKVVDVGSFLNSRKAPVEAGPGTTPSLGEELTARMATKPAAPSGVSMGEDAVAALGAEYAEKSFAELRALAKARSLAGGGTKAELVSRLVESDLG